MGPTWASGAINLPTVSIIIVNYNYGRFLRAAVESALNQTYRNTECILVDNGSGDESAAVMASLEAEAPRLKIIRRTDNGGQTRASLDGFEASRGAYVIFVDADDILLPDAVDHHVFAHLSLRSHVGFTSGDMLQLVDDQVVVGSARALNDYLAAGPERTPATLRPYIHVDEAWPGASIASALSSRVYKVPRRCKTWVWSPTSGLCYRRDALLLFTRDARLDGLLRNTDVYFARGIGALCGSALIDRPVVAYRIHGGNGFTRRAELEGVQSFEPGVAGDYNALAKLLLIDHLIAHAERFVSEPWVGPIFLRMLFSIDHRDPDPTLPAYARRSRVARRLVDHASELAGLLGRRRLAFAFLRARVPLGAAVRALRRG